MKIFKWRIFSQERVDKIKKLIEGGLEDRKMASELLSPTRKELDNNTYPKYTIEVTANEATLYYQLTLQSKWEKIDFSYCSKGRDSAIEDMRKMADKMKPYHKAELEKKKFKTYRINL